jgi:Reverse transcriptase (RNA-dependent DNA polymerase).
MGIIFECLTVLVELAAMFRFVVVGLAEMLLWLHNNTYYSARSRWTKQHRYPDDVNLIGNDIKTTERNVDVLLNACEDIGLAVNTEKTKYMEIGHY